MHKVNFIPFGVALLAFASVATALRFNQLPIGVGELASVFLFFVALRYRNALRYVKHPIILFWLSFLLLAGIAALFSSAPGEHRMHTGVAYVYTACFSLMALAFLDQIPENDFRSVIRMMVVVPVVFLLVPFFCFITGAYDFAEFIGINTAYQPRISAWSANPNQLALFVLPLPVWFMAVSKRSHWNGFRWFWNFLFFLAFFIFAFCIRSDALLLAWAVGLPLLAFVAAYWMEKPDWKMFGAVITAFVLAFCMLKFFVDGRGREILDSTQTAVTRTITEFFASTPESKGDTVPLRSPTNVIKQSDTMLGVGFVPNKTEVRLALWVHAIEAWQQSPIFGHGPGAFSYQDDPGVRDEAHNLVLDTLTQTGVAGVLVLSALCLWLLFIIWKARDPYSLTVLVVLMLFSSAHFTLRQPVFTLNLIFCAIAAKHGSFARPKVKRNLKQDT